MEARSKTQIGLLIPCDQLLVSSEKVLKSISEDLLSKIDEVILIDHTEGQSNLEIVKRLQNENTALSQKLTLIKNKNNYNTGGNLKVGFNYLDKKNFDSFIILDELAQFGPNEFANQIIDHLEKEPDLNYMLASRFCNDADMMKNNLFEMLVHFLLKYFAVFATGKKINDINARVVYLKTAILKNTNFKKLSNSKSFYSQFNIILQEKNILHGKLISLSKRNHSTYFGIEGFGLSFNLILTLFSYWLSRFGANPGFAEDQVFHNESTVFESKNRLTPSLRIENFKHIEKPWGFETLIAHSDHYALKKIFLKKGSRSSLQSHEMKHESIFIEKGKLLLEYSQSVENIRTEEYKQGEAYMVKPNVIHRVTALEDTLLWEVSTSEIHDVIRHQDDYARI